MILQRPLPEEYNPYFQRYIDRVPEGDFQALLAEQTAATLAFFENIPAGKHGYRYAPGKWSIREVLLHLIDTERVFAYRALVAARCDGAIVLPSMEEDHYATYSEADRRTMKDLLEEFRAVRSAGETLFRSLSERQATFQANSNGFPVTARAIAYMMLGHVLHHRAVLEERYLG